MIVYGRRSSINVQKVLWALGELGIDFRRETIGGSFGGNDRPEFRAMNPNGLIPVLRDGDVVMFESNAIVRYLAVRYGAGTLLPKDPHALAAAEQWMEWSQTTLAPPASVLFMNQVRTPADRADRKAMADAEARLQTVLAIADKALVGKAFFAGDALTIGDIVLGCFRWRLDGLAWKRPPMPNLDRWFAALKERPAYKQWVMVPVGRSPAEWTSNERALT
ncbi:MAG: glutathione S-transferase family protein [Rhizobiales bacterium]|nr:glutathione S-transferase family protein [Hyphomicrobiales bacterium]